MSGFLRAADLGTRSSGGAWPWLAALGVSAFLVGSYGCAQRACIEGTIVPPEAASAGGVVNTIVWVESKRTHAEPSPDTLLMRCTESRFEPAWLVAPVGARLRFLNESGVFHTPFSPDPKAGFRLEGIRPGETAQITLTEPGELHLFCELHPEATAVLMVLPGGEHAEVDKSGRFRLAALPSGSYVVSYWHPEWGAGQRRVEVPAKGPAQVELKF